MKDKIVEKADRHREQDEIGEQLIRQVGEGEAARLQPTAIRVAMTPNTKNVSVKFPSTNSVNTAIAAHSP
jgi:hypothetical protein